MSNSHAKSADMGGNPFKKQRIGESDRGIVREENLRHKLYVGNMDKRITEAGFLKLMQPFGKIVNMEYMWQSFGAERGKPRGFAFCEYQDREVRARRWRAANLFAISHKECFRFSASHRKQWGQRMRSTARMWLANSS